MIKVEKKASNILRNIFVGIVRNLGLSTAYVYIINIIPKILLEIKFAIMRIILATLTLKSIWKVLVPNFASQLSYKRNMKKITNLDTRKARFNCSAQVPHMF